MELIEPRWHKSTRSDGGGCVEVADNIPGRVLVRDTKDRAGGTLAFGPAAWSAFVGFARDRSGTRQTRLGTR